MKNLVRFLSVSVCASILLLGSWSEATSASWTSTGLSGQLPYGTEIRTIVHVTDTEVYAGTDAGVYQFDGQVWSGPLGNINSATGLAYGNGSLYVSAGFPGNMSVFRWNSGTQSWSFVFGTGNASFIQQLVYDGSADLSQQTLYAATSNKGVYAFDLVNNQLVGSPIGGYPSGSISGGASGDYVLAIAKDSALGTLYIGTKKGASYLAPGDSSWSDFGSGCPNGEVSSLAFVSANEIYLGTDSGIYRATGASLSCVPFNGAAGNPIANFSIVSMTYVSPTEMYAVGFSDGVYRYDGTDWLPFVGAGNNLHFPNGVNNTLTYIANSGIYADATDYDNEGAGGEIYTFPLENNCGNGTVDSGELCDGGDLNGASCDSILNPSGDPSISYSGAPGCTSDCQHWITDGVCQVMPEGSSDFFCDEDGVCEHGQGESYNNCPADCTIGSPSSAAWPIIEGASGCSINPTNVTPTPLGNWLGLFSIIGLFFTPFAFRVLERCTRH